MRAGVSARVEIGSDPAGSPITIDLQELLATRLLVQGNSGSGKSHLLRRLLEESANTVQQVVIDPEGDFVTLAEPFGHIVIDGAAYSSVEIERLAARVRKHRASVVLARSLPDVDTAAIVNSFAYQAGLIATRDGIAVEKKENNPYVNIIVVREQDKDAPWVPELVKAYHSEAVRQFILTKFEGSVIPVF